MKRKLVILLLTLIFLVFSGLTLIFYNSFILVEVREIYLDVGVDKEIMGFSIDTDALHFGKIPAGNEGYRQIYLVQNDWEKVRLNIKAYGEVKDWVSLEENNFVLRRNEEKLLGVFVHVPKNTVDGNYNGTLKIYFRKII